MQVTLIKEQTIRSFVLPDKVKGQFWVTDKTETNHDYNFISIEAVNEKWFLKSNKSVSIFNEQQTFKSIPLESNLIYRLRVLADDSECLLFTEPVSLDRQVYKKVVVPNNSTIKIGRADSNDIVYKNSFFSTHHAVLSYAHGKWNITDNNSTNGTFVNGTRVTREQIFPGDLVYIMGFKIIIGNGLIAFNNPDNLVNLVSDIFESYKPILPSPLEEDPDEVKIEYFSRSPRFKRNIEEATFKIDNPPSSGVTEETPLLLVMGPALTMGLTSMTTGLFAVNNAITNGNIASALPSIIMSVSMLMGALLWPTMNKRYEKEKKAKREAKRIKKYNEYLDYYRAEIDKEIVKQKEILEENSLTIEECVDIIENTKRNLWERNSSQNDFLILKLGIGDLKLNAKIMYSERRFTLDEDNLQENMLDLCESAKIINDVPINLSISKEFIVGVIGDRKKSIELAKSFIYQISSYYGYDEVKTIFIYDESENEFDFVKWLPHTWSNDRKFRFVANNVEEMKEMSAYLEKEIEYRSNVSENNLDDIKTHYVVFALDRNLSIRSDLIKQVLTLNKPIKFSILSFYDELRLLPKECSAVVELADHGRIFDKNDVSGRSIQFTTQPLPQLDSLKISTILSNTYLDTLDSKFKLPKVVSFLEMFKVGKVEHLNANIRWKDNDPTKTLQTEVGVDALGGLFKLDLHEKYHGPHGLVAGMTGSGKSEFIISYILSLAVNYHPNEVAFILIDYKGGGMAKSFENLPHTAGIITNLDGSAIKRSLVSIESELKRRQAMFGEAGKKNSVSNIDIYKYQKLYREGNVSDPLQHLFIISDEFAELKSQQPEFMAKLISTARIGRSLGVHLILATQKPSGVVDDQIWSNSKFRVCLKVQERADSMDMLKRPDAAELTDTGRFYLQVGYNELFEIGQSAWAGASYVESDKVITEVDNSVIFIDKNGRVLSQMSPSNKMNLTKNPKKQLDVITEYLQKTAKEEKVKIRPLWLEPIPANS
jgi:DNA segregation ATPase FtsK/SpoIIIE, S-DNA-T family